MWLQTSVQRGSSVAAQGVAEAVGGGLVVALHEEDFSDAIGGERAVLVGVQGFLVLAERAGQVALSNQLLPAQHGDADGEVGGALSTQFSGSMEMRRGRPKVSMV